MSNIATSIEQSKHLLELGLDPKTADMYYTGHRSIFNPKEIEYTQEPRIRTKFVSFDRLEVFFPAWSLQALLEVMPKDTNETYHLFSSMMADQLGSWVCDRSKYYMDADGHNKNDYECFKSNSPIIAGYKMVCWLLEQGLIKKEEQY